MVNSISAQEAPHETRIDVDESYEMIYWTARLGCTSRQLREAISAVGTSVNAIIAFVSGSV